MKLFIIGPLPPPFGGISNHIDRLRPYLTKTKIEYSIVNQYAGKKLATVFMIFYILFFKRNVHVHLFSKYLLIPLFVISNLVPFKKFILTIHNDRLIGDRLIHFLVRKSRFFRILVVSKGSVKYWSVKTKNEVVYLPAFIPCDSALAKPGSHTRIIANVWSYYDGVVDDYGLDILFKFIDTLPDVKFVIYIGDQNSKQDFDLILPQLNNLQVVYGVNLAREFKASDIFLRLNREDAYGVSIVEAMCCQVPALVTNVCRRPQGALTFTSYETLFSKLVEVLACDVSLRHRYLEDFVIPDFHSDLLKIYKTQLGIL